ncbi:glucosyltransferase [Microbotryomycetes sp. JL221]|nr:glucosyltransferase [Microbotryomycetes sp. JL221]
MSSAQIAAYGSFAALAAWCAYLVNVVVPEPYMDEIIHVAQAQAYCRGQWTSWDPRLTTPPGLYLITAAPARLLKQASNKICSVNALRTVNLIFLVLLPFVYTRLLDQLRHPILRSSTKGKQTPRDRDVQAREHEASALEGIVVAMFPVAAFFAFLYYTDLGGLSLILLSLTMGISKRWTLSALAGATSLLFRQTNIIWVAFIAATCAVRHLQPSSELFDPALAQARWFDIPHALASLVKQSLINIRVLVPVLARYTPVFAFALAFLRWNGGIVLDASCQF